VLLPLRIYTFASGGRLSIDVSTHLKTQLLRGAFRLHPDEVRRQGAGQLLGRTMEVEAIESFTFVGALLTLTASIELLFAGMILAAGAAGAAHTLLLGLWTGVLVGTATVYFRRRNEWTESRLDLTNGLVEQMVGHRTRAVQEPRPRWNQQEDRDLERYHDIANRQDRWEVALDTLIPRGWFLIGMAGLAPAFVAGGHSAGAVAAGIGGVLLAQRAFKGLASGIEQLTGAVVAWQRIQALLQARRRPEPVGLPTTTVREPAADTPTSIRPVLDARGLGFRYPRRGDAILERADLEVYTGDRVLLQGPSGGGKSTLARLLAALERPDKGVPLLDGMDPSTLGLHEWRRRIVFVPQFHDNHVLMGSMAYNLLMGRTWPPAPADLGEAESVCRALGLGPLLERMPGGIFQMVGETGWQLSHGERSRIFLARAILQKPDVMILDESFAALDPQTLRCVQETLLASDSAILLIAHP
jgi:ATP-binding cassette, subfamily B, bacterial